MADPWEREALITDLVALAGDGAVPARIVATLRADHLEAPLSHVALGPLIAPSLFPIGPMTTSELQRAIALPAAAVGATVDDELVGELVAEIGTRPNALPLMQFTLTELFDLNGGDDLTLGSVPSAGWVGGCDRTTRGDGVRGPQRTRASARANRVRQPGIDRRGRIMGPSSGARTRRARSERCRRRGARFVRGSPPARRRGRLDLAGTVRVDDPRGAGS